MRVESGVTCVVGVEREGSISEEEGFTVAGVGGGGIRPNSSHSHLDMSRCL